ncbi:hypothetical protein [Streptomyces spororaveus]|uniref:Lipoprotein n=1 Tax=Streptomyces spororaveus TaxID=284039 RepID=A0ABQ3THY0_9ACTN|nr:hypothetical protein [Streptomyces spororaveus]MCM9079654.1 hypothetical protein [Streptomyces spororaveus]GHI80018.1 hypothetical protein Sspor_55790 [Streptomyces spororaveus]
MPIRIRPGRAAALLLSAAIVAGGLSGCSFLSPFKTCEGTGARMKELESLPLLSSPPPGASAPRTFDGVYSECADDSGDAWLSAGRTYVYPGTRQEVLDHYRKAAEADGWRFEPERTPDQGRFGSCFTKGGDGQAKVFTLSFPPVRLLTEFYGPGAAAEFATGAGFEITVGSEADGAETSCWS